MSDFVAARATPPAMLQGFTPEGLLVHCEREGFAVGITIDEARKVIAHATQRGHDTGRDIANVRRHVRDEVFANIGVGRFELVERHASSVDPFVKYVFRLADGSLIETVRIPLHKEGRFSVCVSSQVGCALGCRFCATGTMGLVRHLAAWEIVEQVRYVARELREEKLGRVRGVVFQGMGEPLHNVEQVIDALGVMSHPCGLAIDARQITVCTAGMIPGILQLAQRAPRVRLAISVTTARRDVRRSLMPIEKRYDIGAVLDAARVFQKANGRMVMLSFALMRGVNTSLEDARALSELIGTGSEDPLPVRLSLVEHNTFEGSDFERPDAEEYQRFVDELMRLGVPVVRRYSGGGDIGAACGQLVTEGRDRGASATLQPES
ncbi:MAG: 23S rRNA (adenine(2503)-C(2))-methyltransferase RlmN [Deltaproteobacteria bacterium]|nr:23S rRNA (adenine(2503)-C(2))-methyltransferase RlmN [Deltaproteobacteria bacterium]